MLDIYQNSASVPNVGRLQETVYRLRAEAARQTHRDDLVTRDDAAATPLPSDVVVLSSPNWALVGRWRVDYLSGAAPPDWHRAFEHAQDHLAVLVSPADPPFSNGAFLIIASAYLTSLSRSLGDAERSQIDFKSPIRISHFTLGSIPGTYAQAVAPDFDGGNQYLLAWSYLKSGPSFAAV